MLRIVTTAITFTMIAGNAFGGGAPGQLRKDAGAVHPQSMAAAYGGKASNSAPSSTTTFGGRELNFKATVSYNSEYVFRGEQFAKHNVAGGMEISSGGFYGGAWAILPTADRFDAFQTEIDVYGGYGFDLTESVYADIGITGYIHNSAQAVFSRKDSAEVYAGVTLNMALNPSLYGFYDFEKGTTTVEAALNYSLPFGRTDLNLGVTGGYADGNGFEYGYFQADAEVVYNFTRQASIGVGGHWAISEDNRFIDGLSLSDNNSSWYGITLKTRN